MLEWRYKWVRTHTMGEADRPLLSPRYERVGWQLVPVDDPEFKPPSGGLILCRMPEAMAVERSGYFQQKAADTLAAPAANYLAHNEHPAMAKFVETSAPRTDKESWDDPTGTPDELKAMLEDRYASADFDKWPDDERTQKIRAMRDRLKKQVGFSLSESLKEYFSMASLIAHPERAGELVAYYADIEANGPRFKSLWHDAGLLAHEPQ